MNISFQIIILLSIVEIKHNTVVKNSKSWELNDIQLHNHFVKEGIKEKIKLSLEIKMAYLNNNIGKKSVKWEEVHNNMIIHWVKIKD